MTATAMSPQSPSNPGSQPSSSAAAAPPRPEAEWAEIYGRSRQIAHDPVGLARDLYHGVAVFLCSVGLMVDRVLRIGDTYFTYKYCHHLERMTWFREMFRKYLTSRPDRIDQWKRPQVWVDEMPDMDALATLPEGSLGRQFYVYNRELEDAGLPNLRPKRLKALPHEARALDRSVVENETDPDRLFDLIVARRNIYMTSSHDFYHFLSGSNTRIAGEALVARYQFRHLLCPQNWMNMKNSLLAHFALGRTRPRRTVEALFEKIDGTRDFTVVDWNQVWDRPLAEVRRDLGLPEEGYMPGGVVPGETW